MCEGQRCPPPVCLYGHLMHPRQQRREQQQRLVVAKRARMKGKASRGRCALRSKSSRGHENRRAGEKAVAAAANLRPR